MTNKIVSIQDIAQAAGVSHTTVSRALRNSPLISSDVRKQIRQLAQEMGYTPNAVAQALRGQRTHTVGLVVTTIADPFVGRVARGVDEIAQQHNISLFLSASYNDPEREVAIIENFHRRRVDGVIVAAAKLDAAHERQLARLNVPIVLINQQAESDLDCLHSVSVDDYHGARQAMEHLIGLGHRAIGYLGAGNRPRSNRVRLNGYLDALQDADIAFDERLVRTAPPERRYHSDDVADGHSLLPAIITAGASAVFCYNDMIAIGGMLACRAMGIAVPSQFSIVGFDDVETAQYVTPPLTTVHQPKLRIGKLAMEMLLNLIKGQPVEDHMLPTELVVRASSAPPATG